MHDLIRSAPPVWQYAETMNDDPGIAIWRKARALRLGAPLAATPVPQPISDGYYQCYRSGWLIWRAQLGVHFLSNTLVARWQELGGAAGFLGFPLTDALLPTDCQEGERFCDFQGGSLYRSPRHGPVVLRGVIRDYWADLGGVASVLGFPISDEILSATSAYIVQHFTGGSIVWHPETGRVDHL